MTTKRYRNYKGREDFRKKLIKEGYSPSTSSTYESALLDINRQGHSAAAFAWDRLMGGKPLPDEYWTETSDCSGIEDTPTDTTPDMPSEVRYMLRALWHQYREDKGRNLFETMEAMSHLEKAGLLQKPPEELLHKLLLYRN